MTSTAPLHEQFSGSVLVFSIATPRMSTIFRLFPLTQLELREFLLRLMEHLCPGE